MISAKELAEGNDGKTMNGLPVQNNILIRLITIQRLLWMRCNEFVKMNGWKKKDGFLITIGYCCSGIRLKG